jgi:hypothetical protein
VPFDVAAHKKGLWNKKKKKKIGFKDEVETVVIKIDAKAAPTKTVSVDEGTIKDAQASPTAGPEREASDSSSDADASGLSLAVTPPPPSVPAYHESDWTGCPILRLNNPDGYQEVSVEDEAATAAEGDKGKKKKDTRKDDKKGDANAPPPGRAPWKVPSYVSPLSMRDLLPQLVLWTILGCSNAVMLWLFRRLFGSLSMQLFFIFVGLHLADFAANQVLGWYTNSVFIAEVEAKCRVFVFQHVMKLSPEQAARTSGLAYSANYAPMVYRDVVGFIINQSCPSFGATCATVALLFRIDVMYSLSFVLAGVLSLFFTDVMAAPIAALRSVRSSQSRRTHKRHATAHRRKSDARL